MSAPFEMEHIVKALDAPYVPSLFELEEYCRNKEHRKCPFYLKDIIKPDMVEHMLSA